MIITAEKSIPYGPLIDQSQFNHDFFHKVGAQYHSVRLASLRRPVTFSGFIHWHDLRLVHAVNSFGKQLLTLHPPPSYLPSSTEVSQPDRLIEGLKYIQSIEPQVR